LRSRYEPDQRLKEITMAITVVARLKARPGSEAQLEQAFRKMIPAVRSEAETLQYVLHRSVQDPTVFVFYEVYQDQDALGFHSRTAHMKEMSSAIGPLLDGRPQIDVLTELDRK
jgi:quinol monooxygenase YgiN